MTPEQEAFDGLAAQEAESLGGCIARGQSRDSYTDIIAKLRGHCERLPASRREFWTEQCRSLGVELFPKRKAKDE